MTAALSMCLAVLTHRLPLAPRLRRLPRRLHLRMLSKGPQEPQLHVAGLSYDLETTGIGPTAEIVQIAVHTANSARDEPPSFSAYVMPQGPISEAATAVHGLTRDSLVAAEAEPFDEVWRRMEAWIEATFGSQRPLVFCAHNGASFDHLILSRECGRLGKDLAGGEYARWHFHDTLPLARQVLRMPICGSNPRLADQPRLICWPDVHAPFGAAGRFGPGSYTLSRLFEDATTGRSFAGAHDALADARALSTVWRWLATFSLPPSADEPERAARFQHELQLLGYPPPAAARPKASSAKRRAPKSTVSNGQSESNDPPLVGATPALELPGIGPATAKRLAKRGVACADDLLEKAQLANPDVDARSAVQQYCRKHLHGIMHPANMGRLSRWCERFAQESEN